MLELVGLRRFHSRLGTRVDELRRRAEMGHAFGVGIVEEIGARMMEVICKCGIKNKADIIKYLDDTRREFMAKTGRKKGEHVDPFALSRKWYRKILRGFTIRLPCEKCGHVNEVKDHKCIEYIELDRSTRGNP